MDVVTLPGRTDYREAWDLQRRTHEAVQAGAPGVTFLLEHEDVYTAGRRTRRDEYPTDGTDVVDVDRGGKITWHGPGQIVAYPIVALRSPVDVVQYIRTLESAVMDVCATLGLETARVEGRSGVWFPADGATSRRERKVSAVGARVARGVTMHGLSLNCDPDLSAFDTIVPCGIDDADVTSLSAEVGRRVTVDEIRPVLASSLVERLAPLVTELTTTEQDIRPASTRAAVG
ncbi:MULTISPECIES: lipoyl(octanoyl) transferase LipB [Isoptericola]|uniref:lipoyl(octanoyl) transferase LipB n=1 Tax=Isoptericola TaxID=254250 RepID=UPI00383A84BF